MAAPPPTTVATAPDVVDSALADTSEALVGGVRQAGRQRGEDEPVDREDGQPGGVERRPLHAGRAPAPATTATRPARSEVGDAAAPAGGSTGPARRRRRARPGSTGSSRTANPAATATGSAARCGLNSTVPASAAWKTPSPNWASSRVASSRRKSPRSEQVTHVVAASPACGTPVTLGGPAASARSPPGRARRARSGAPTLTCGFPQRGVRPSCDARVGHTGPR